MVTEFTSKLFRGGDGVVVDGVWFLMLTPCLRLFHCAPNVPHYAKNKAVGVMKPGHCFTIEPMINEGVWGDQTWPDNWTSVTQVSDALTREYVRHNVNNVRMGSCQPSSSRPWW